MTRATLRTAAEDHRRHGERLATWLLEAGVGALDLFHVYIGDRLGLYQVLAEHGPLDAAGLAGHAGVAPRYAQEWLEHQAVAGLVDVVEGPQGGGHQFAVSPDHAEVLVDGTSLRFLAPLAAGVVAVAQALPSVIDAFVHGTGVPYHRYGPDLRWCLGRLQRPRFFHHLGRHWIPAMPDVERRLRAAPPARVADIGCGTGWSTIALALAYPGVHADGFDPDEVSIAEARIHAAAHGVADRVSFVAGDVATGHPAAGRYDLVCAFGAIHDRPDPVATLAAMRHLAGRSGAVLVADANVAETFAPPGDNHDRFHYGWSTLHSLPLALSGGAGADRVSGAVLRPPTLRRYALAAGFTGVEVLPIEEELWCFYRLIYQPT
jgi:SAM-dependent methyltransferase